MLVLQKKRNNRDIGIQRADKFNGFKKKNAKIKKKVGKLDSTYKKECKETRKGILLYLNCLVFSKASFK